MIRKAKERRRICNQGVEKKKSWRKVSKSSILPQLEELLSAKYRENVYDVVDKSFKLLGFVCCKLCFVALSVDDDGKYEIQTSLRQLILHYCLLGVLCTRIIQHAVVIMFERTSESLDLTMILCVLSVLIHIAGLVAPVSLLLKRHETVQLLNTLPMIMQFYQTDGKKLRILENPKSAFLFLAIIAVCSFAIFVIPALNFVVDSLPVSLYHILNKTGLVSFFLWVPTLVWKLVLWLPETLIMFQSLTLGAWAAITALAILSASNHCPDNLRKIPMGSLSSCLELERRYLVFQVFFKLCDNWVKLMIVPSLTCLSAIIVVFLYITIRHTDLPLVIYLCFPWMGLTMLVGLFMLSFEAMNVVGRTEEIVGVLASFSQDGFGRLSVEQTLYQKKVVRATRAVAIHVGDFMDFSFDVAKGIWDEILNQLVFLLTL